MEYIPSFRDDLHSDVKPSFIAHSFRDEHDAKMMYGLPKVKKFPMPDAKHVRSAIRFFNYAKPSQEQELANAILARMRDYGIDPNDINVGDDNRFKKYLQHSYLAHHGIKGMHWGIRRYQNPDGSLTSQGKKRYSLNPIKRMQQKRADKKALEEKKKAADREYRERLDDLDSRSQMVDKEWLDLCYKYEDPIKADKLDKASNKYWDSYDTEQNEDLLEKCTKLAYDFGYDYGEKAGHDLVKKYGNDAVNRFLDLWSHEGSYYTRAVDFDSMNNRDGVKRFAEQMAQYETDHI